MSKYLRIWLKSGVFFGCCMGIFYTFQNMNYVTGPIGGLAAGVLFGASMASLTYLCDLRMKRRGIDNNSSEVDQVECIKIYMCASDVRDRIENAILSIKKAKIATVDDHLYSATIGATWKSFGEKVTVSIEPIDDKSTSITIRSKPSLSTTIVDYGKNLENVKAISNYLLDCFEKNVQGDS